MPERMEFSHGGGGSGGAIRLVGKNIDIWSYQCGGGNRGASGGRVAIGASGMINQGVVSVANGSFKKLSPSSYSP